MAKTVDRGRTAQILQFVREFSCVHGFGPTIREIAEGVGLRSTSTVADYLDRMTRDGLITSIPSTPRSIRVVEQNLTEDACEDGSSLVCCKFKFPEGTYPMLYLKGATIQLPIQLTASAKIEPHEHRYVDALCEAYADALERSSVSPDEIPTLPKRYSTSFSSQGWLWL